MPHPPPRNSKQCFVPRAKSVPWYKSHTARKMLGSKACLQQFAFTGSRANGRRAATRLDRASMQLACPRARFAAKTRVSAVGTVGRTKEDARAFEKDLRQSQRSSCTAPRTHPQSTIF